MSLGYVSRSMVLETGDVEDYVIPADTWTKVRERLLTPDSSTHSRPAEVGALKEQRSAHYMRLAEALRASNSTS